MVDPAIGVVIGNAVGAMVQSLLAAISKGDVKTVEALSAIIERPEMNELRDRMLEEQLDRRAREELPAGPPALSTNTGK